MAEIFAFVNRRGRVSSLCPKYLNTLMSEDKMNDTTILLDCAHCNKSGVCSSGKEGLSCEVCRDLNEIKKPSNGLPCSVCHGTGKTPPRTPRFKSAVERHTALLALFLCYFILVLIGLIAFFKIEALDRILPFSTTVMGTVLGYYFAKKD